MKRAIIASDMNACHLMECKNEYEGNWVLYAKEESLFSGEYYEVIEFTQKTGMEIYTPYHPFKEKYPGSYMESAKKEGINYLRLIGQKCSWKSTIEYISEKRTYILQWEETEGSYILGFWDYNDKNRTYIDTFKNEKEAKVQLFETIRKDTLRDIFKKESKQSFQKK